jgi:hypothetical protein
MNKIPTMFERDWEGDRSRVIDKVVPGCEWVLAGEGTPTRKYDGTCVMFDGVNWWARREVKEGKGAPAGFQPVSHDPETGKIGWESIANSPFAKFHVEALLLDDYWPEGTYELCGPKVQGNPEGYSVHSLIWHPSAEVLDVPDRSFAGISATLKGLDVEGIVFHHPDGRMAKIKGRDFGLRRAKS